MATYKVTLVKANQEIGIIECAGNKYILESAEDNNIELPYSCRAGS
eukprot:gene64383-88061_t